MCWPRGPGESCPTAPSGEWGNSGPRPPWAGLRAHTRHVAVGHHRPPWGPRPGHTRQGLPLWKPGPDVQAPWFWICVGALVSLPAVPGYPQADRWAVKSRSKFWWGGGGLPKSFRATPGCSEDGHRLCFVLGIRGASGQPWHSRRPRPSGWDPGHSWPAHLAVQARSGRGRVELPKTMPPSTLQPPPPKPSFCTRTGRRGRSTLSPKVKEGAHHAK